MSRASVEVLEITCDDCGQKILAIGKIAAWWMSPVVDLCPACWRVETDEAGDPRAVRISTGSGVAW